MLVVASPGGTFICWSPPSCHLKQIACECPPGLLCNPGAIVCVHVESLGEGACRGGWGLVRRGWRAAGERLDMGKPTFLLSMYSDFEHARVLVKHISV